MKIQEGTMVTATINSPPVKVTGVVTQVRENTIDERQVVLANIIFQTESKPQGVYAFYVEGHHNRPEVMKVGVSDAPSATNLEVVE